VSERIVELINVSKVFRLGFLGRTTIPAVTGLTMWVNKREIYSLVGESGSGKTTVAKMILGFYKPTEGKVLIDGVDVNSLKDSKWLYRKVQGVFQDPYAGFNPVRPVDRILRVTAGFFHGNRSEADRLTLIRQTLERVGLSPSDVLGKYPHQLSGGQLQRVAIARALLAEPELIVADEPVSMLDASTRIDVLNIFLDLKDEGISVLLIGHDISLANYVSDRVGVMYRGVLVEEGEATQVFNNPLHPYTQMLVSSVPRIDKKWEKASAFIPEKSEEEVYALKGCKFALRCPFATERCKTEQPKLIEVDGRRVACWRLE